MTQTATPAKILVLLKASDNDSDFVCPDCQTYVARLKRCAVADLTDPETYAVSALLKQKEDYFSGVKVMHKGRIGDGYCRNIFSFYAIDKGLVRAGTVIKIEGPYATAR